MSILGDFKDAVLGKTDEAPAGEFSVQKSDTEWQSELSPQQFHVLRQHGTERPGTSPLLHEHRAGVFKCAACGTPLYSSETKFESGSGWPSFWKPLPGAIKTVADNSLFMARTEVLCANCGGHLGHVFPDGPNPTGERYCMNGVALDFEPNDSAFRFDPNPDAEA